MSRRRQAREVVLQLLYERDINPCPDPEFPLEFVAEQIGSVEVRAFAIDLFEGVRRERQKLDEAIERAAENWRLSRISPVDRNILRIGCYELLFSGQTPAKVAIDEAIELAKRFGTADSPRFVNGVLDQVLAQRDQKGQESPRVASSSVRS